MAPKVPEFGTDRQTRRQRMWRQKFAACACATHVATARARAQGTGGSTGLHALWSVRASSACAWSWLLIGRRAYLSSRSSGLREARAGSVSETAYELKNDQSSY